MEDATWNEWLEMEGIVILLVKYVFVKAEVPILTIAKPAVVLTGIPSVVPLLHVTARHSHRAGRIGPSLLAMLISVDRSRY